MQSKSGRWIFFTVVAVVVSYVILVIVLWKVGLIDFTGTDNSAKVYSALIALVGGFFSVIVSIIGLILKYSLDQRNTDIKEQAERRLELESQRNNALKTEAENRLKLEAAIRAVGLLSTNTGTLAPMIQRAGALFALTSLNRYKLATALTAELLAKDELDAYSASSILDHAIESGDQRTQEEAIGVFNYYVERFLSPNGAVVLPDSLHNWRADLTDYSRQWAAMALGRLLIARPLSEWDENHANAILSALSLAWLRETKEELKQDVGAILKSALKAYPGLDTIFHPQQQIRIRDIRFQVASVTPFFDAVIALQKRIEKWVAEGS